MGNWWVNTRWSYLNSTFLLIVLWRIWKHKSNICNICAANNNKGGSKDISFHVLKLPLCSFQMVPPLLHILIQKSLLVFVLILTVFKNFFFLTLSSTNVFSSKYLLHLCLDLVKMHHILDSEFFCDFFLPQHHFFRCSRTDAYRWVNFFSTDVQYSILACAAAYPFTYRWTSGLSLFYVSQTILKWAFLCLYLGAYIMSFLLHYILG